MAKHPLDHVTSEAHADRFADIARKSGPEGGNPAVREVVKRPRTRTPGRKVEEFARIERGLKA